MDWKTNNMNEKLINIINTELQSEFSFLKTFGITRIGEKKDGTEIKKYPTAVNELQENCNTDKEIYILPNRDEKGLIWWEILNTKKERVFKNVNLMQSSLKMYLWLNADKINKEETSFIDNIIAAFPEEIQENPIIKATIKNINYKSQDFVKYSFDKQYMRKPYYIFQVEMTGIIYYNCLSNLISKTYDVCGNIVS